MKTKRIPALDGHIVFEMAVPTFASDALKQEARDRLRDEIDGEPETWQGNLAAYLALTTDVEIGDDPGLDDFRTFWEMSRNGATLTELFDFWRENVQHGIYNAWYDAFYQSIEVLAAGPTEKPGHLLTPEERADPN